MYKDQNQQLPPCVQDLFHPRESKYNLRGTAIFTLNDARVNNKGRCVSVVGVKLWNSLDAGIKKTAAQ